MLEKNRVFTRKKALALVLICAADDLSTPEGRQMFLSELGWEIDLSTETHKSVMIPDTLEGVMEDYNNMQLKQGYDLSGHLGEKCEQYTYLLTNYPDSSEKVLVTIYIQGRDIIAGDIHTSSIDGFMHGIKREGA